MTEVLKQGQYSPLTVDKQVISLYAATKGYVDDIPVGDVTRFEKELLAFVASSAPEITESITKEKKITEENEKALVSTIKAFKQTFKSSETR
jgi:F-type H+-transporting ATPase subunit alpha